MNLTVLPFKESMRLLTGMIALCLLAACHKQANRKNEITKIEIAMSNDLPHSGLAVRIDSSLSYHYYGDTHHKPSGYYTGNTSRGFWDTLNIKLEHINYKQLDTVYNIQPDGEATEIIIYWKDHKKHLHKDLYRYPDSVAHVFRWIVESYKGVKLKQTQDTFHFETTYQYPPPVPQLPKDFRFLPPKLDEK